MRENPFRAKDLVIQKGCSLMDSTASTPLSALVSSSGPTDLLSFFEWLLEQIEQTAELSQPTSPGRPAELAGRHLWLGLVAGVLRGVKSYADIWRMLVWERLGSFAPTTVTAMAVRNRLLRQ